MLKPHIKKNSLSSFWCISKRTLTRFWFILLSNILSSLTAQCAIPIAWCLNIQKNPTTKDRLRQLQDLHVIISHIYMMCKPQIFKKLDCHHFDSSLKKHNVLGWDHVGLLRSNVKTNGSCWNKLVSCVRVEPMTSQVTPPSVNYDN